MEQFYPGLEYQIPYKHFIWVCTNSLSRQFEKCGTPEDQKVLQRIREKVSVSGLGREVFVFASAQGDFSAGCLLGCKVEGTTVAVISNVSVDNPQGQVSFWRKVTVNDVDEIIQALRN